MKFRTRNWDENGATVKRSEYPDGSTRLTVLDRFGRAVCEATVCLRDYQERPQDGCVFISNWDDNRGVLHALQDAGVIGRTLRTVQTGPPLSSRLAHECRLLP